MSKQLDLEKLAQDIIQKHVCPELAVGATQLVMGTGNPAADIVFVGEAPGKKEDELGVPFVGASGRFLDEMLAAADMSRDEVYVTNIVKYRPPGNRDPSVAEKEAFWPYLLRQLHIIQPKVVMTLGRHSGACFVPDLKISEGHGRVHMVRTAESELTVIPLYHPAAALYNGSMRQVLIDDFVAAVAAARSR